MFLEMDISNDKIPKNISNEYKDANNHRCQVVEIGYTVAKLVIKWPIWL